MVETSLCPSETTQTLGQHQPTCHPTIHAEGHGWTPWLRGSGFTPKGVLKSSGSSTNEYIIMYVCIYIYVYMYIYIYVYMYIYICVYHMCVWYVCNVM